MTRKTLRAISKELEGRYFVFRWTDHDINYEGSCLVVFQLKNGKLNGIAGYGRYAEEMEVHGDEITNSVIQQLADERIKEVYSVINSHASNKVFGLELYRDNPEELDDDGAINEWSELEAICESDYEFISLTNAGIGIRF